MISKNISDTNERKAEEVTTRLPQNSDITTFACQLRDIAPSSVEGNVSGRHSGERQKWFSVSEESLRKRKVPKGQKKPSEQQ